MITINKISENEYLVNEKSVMLNKGFDGSIVSFSYSPKITGNEIIFFRQHLSKIGVLRY